MASHTPGPISPPPKLSSSSYNICLFWSARRAQWWYKIGSTITRKKNVSGREVGVGMINFLHNHYRVLHVAVQKVNPEVGMRQHPPPTDLHWALHRTSCSKEGYPIDTGVWWGWGGPPLRSPDRPMLGLEVFHQKPRYQVHRALWATHPLLLSLTERWTHPRHPPHVFCLLLSSSHA